MAGRILLADTVPTNRISLKVKLSAARYSVEMAAGGKDAMAKAKSFQPNVILLDAEIDDGKAAALCASLKSDPDLAHIPVVIIGHDNAETRLSALRAGAEDFWPRPVGTEALGIRIRALMRTAATAEELLHRKDTACAIGMASADGHPTTIPRIVLAGRGLEEAMKWRAGLSGLIGAEFEIARRASLAETLTGERPADAIVIAADLSDIGETARTLSELRSRAGARYAAILVLYPRGQETKALTALDMGASDVLALGADPEELALRLTTQIMRKREADRLRETIDHGLRLASVDSLTGLYNRRYALPHLDAIATRAARKGAAFCVMLVDIDQFKAVNDTFGHATGDAVLVEVAKRLRNNLRARDMVARIGGEEFLIALPDTSLVEARNAAERLRRAVCASPVARSSEGARVSTSISIGMAMGVGEMAGESGVVDHLISIADNALYASKAEGRNQVTLGSHAA
ncbi:diguanylate cyclase [Celeribacter sp.]|uniref:diguanylate cyclase n=1 Tax=Celeribacter sp. TaxID=1890673 RepID=UPI003A8E4261